MEIFYSSLQLSLHCSFLLNLLLVDLGSLHDYPLPNHLLLYLPKVLKLIFNDSFDLLLRILQCVLWGFYLLMWFLVLSIGISGERHFLSWWSPHRAVWPSSVDGYIIGLCRSMWMAWVGYLCAWVWYLFGWVLAFVVVKTWPPAPWDEPSAEVSLASLFLGGIL
jgi:hypothetical protein